MKKKGMILFSTFLMLAAAAVGGTLAYFTNTDAAKKTFTVGSVAIELYEHKVEKKTDASGHAIWEYVLNGDSKIEVIENRYDGIYPGAVLPKDPTIRNTGENPAYVRMKVTLSNAVAWKESVVSHDLSSIFGGHDETKWTRAAVIENRDEDTITYVYNYNGILAESAETGALFTSINIPTLFDNAEMSAIGGNGGEFTMNISAEAIQATGFNSAGDAFAALTQQQSNPVPA
ncbi:MAG: hypothetical protein GXY01_10575 [Clostridiales bacterium]|jgi:predicted ribosomally synthesized peptide with SipW-like signal peptide|nr:hypothetical protein [Clostridiales bacterium]